MVALVSFLVVVALSVLVERTATVALTLTGLSREAARFQAGSAFSGTGFPAGDPRPVPEPGRRPGGVHHTPSGGEACATGV